MSGVPARLNAMLASGDIDLCPSSSFEYGRAARDYLLLPGQSISSLGPVRSVLLFSRRPLKEFDGVPIAVTGESATSINLLKVLLRHYYGCERVDCFVPDEAVEKVIAGGGDALLIGDRALKMARETGGEGLYDLGEIWWRNTGLPFVFALWIVRRQAVREHADDVLSFSRQLAAARNHALADLEALARRADCPDWFDQTSLVDYWRRMSFDLTDRHLEGLQLYFDLCLRYGLLPEKVRPEFVDLPG
ncbi:MAG: futalosine synthase [Deltaproteobacteria bacterium]|nr:MAG: futalosine synthase [Deltaproteobacteria bacterium]